MFDTLQIGSGLSKLLVNQITNSTDEWIYFLVFEINSNVSDKEQKNSTNLLKYITNKHY